VSTPVFVIHGIANRDRDVLDGRVADLRDRLDDRWEIHPVFWGDLGSAVDHTVLRDVVPGFRESLPEVRGPAGDEPLDEELVALAVALATAPEPGAPPTEPLDEAARVAMVAAGVARAVERDGRFGPGTAEEIVDVLAREWSGELTWLWQVTDPVLLAEVGAGIAGDALRAIADEEFEVRGERVEKAVHAGLVTLNNVVGAALGVAGDRVTRWVRLGVGKVFAEMLGDVLVYQRRYHEIHQRVWDVIKAVDPLLGTDAAHRVHLVGHSLGATIALDMATSSPDAALGPVWTDAVVTFGSLWPVFHLCDPRAAGIRPYTGHPVPLPPSVRRWVNLWEPLDPFAFLAGKAFTLADGTPPRDVPVEHRYASGLGTHSVYWTAPQLVSELARAFEPHPEDLL
jgi:pimeloyl-ACP methyl ester carboxylesterase